jgi:predicted nucleic acid-binding protein
MAGRALVLDASTAILLAKIGLLRELAGFGDLWMSEIAFREATIKDVDDARLIRMLAEEKLIRRDSAKAGKADLEKDFRLDEGEAETIALARKMGAIAGTDDGPAIRCLKVLGLPFTSAIALLGAMAEAGTVAPDLALELLAKLERFGRYDPRILEDVARRLRAAGGGKGDRT